MSPRTPLYMVHQMRELANTTNMSCDQIATRLGVHRNTVTRRLQCLELFGEPYPPSDLVIRGRPRKLSAQQEKVRLAWYISEIILIYIASNAVPRRQANCVSG